MVTNEKFGEFVGNTSYKTDSEKYGWSFVFLPMLSKRQQREIQQVRASGGGDGWHGMVVERAKHAHYRVILYCMPCFFAAVHFSTRVSLFLTLVAAESFCCGVPLSLAV